MFRRFFCRKNQVDATAPTLFIAAQQSFTVAHLPQVFLLLILRIGDITGDNLFAVHDRRLSGFFS